MIGEHGTTRRAVVAAAVAMAIGLRTACAETATPVTIAGDGPLLSVTFDTLPAPPVFVRFARILLEPGALVPSHVHPGPEITLIERGTLTVTANGDVVSPGSSVGKRVPCTATLIQAPGAQTPAWQSGATLEHATQAAPPVPQASGLVPTTQVAPSQQPLAQVAGVHPGGGGVGPGAPQTPPLHDCPLQQFRCWRHGSPRLTHRHLPRCVWR